MPDRITGLGRIIRELLFGARHIGKVSGSWTEGQARNAWTTKRFREGVAVIVVGVMALLAGDLDLGKWLHTPEVLSALAFVAGGLYFIFSGAGQSRLERMTAALHDREEIHGEQVRALANLKREADVRLEELRAQLALATEASRGNKDQAAEAAQAIAASAERVAAAVAGRLGALGSTLASSGVASTPRGPAERARLTAKLN